MDLYGQRVPVSRWIAASPTGLMRCASRLSRRCLQSLSPLRAEMLLQHQCNQAHEHGKRCERPEKSRSHRLPPSLVAQTRGPCCLPHSSTRRLPAHRPTGQSAHQPDGQISPCTAGQYAASLRASCPLDGDVQPVLLLRDNTLYQPAVNGRGVSQGYPPLDTLRPYGSSIIPFVPHPGPRPPRHSERSLANALLLAHDLLPRRFAGRANLEYPIADGLPGHVKENAQ